MDQIGLGRSELRVSRIDLGTWQLGGDWGPTDESAAIVAIRPVGGPSPEQMPESQ